MIYNTSLQLLGRTCKGRRRRKSEEERDRYRERKRGRERRIEGEEKREREARERRREEAVCKNRRYVFTVPIEYQKEAACEVMNDQSAVKTYDTLGNYFPSAEY